jgi:hypothetical protein
MDPAALASATVGLLAPVLGKIADAGLTHVGDSLAGTAAEQLGRLYRAIRNKLAANPDHAAILHRAEERPDSQPRLSEMQDAVRASLVQDPEFAETIARLVDDAKAAGARTVRAAGSGAVAAGDVAMTGRYVAGRDLYVGAGPAHREERERAAGNPGRDQQRRDACQELLVVADAFLDRGRELVARIDADATEAAIGAAHADYLAEWDKLVRSYAPVIMAGPDEMADSAKDLRHALAGLADVCDGWFAARTARGGHRPPARWARYESALQPARDAVEAFVATARKHTT